MGLDELLERACEADARHTAADLLRVRGRCTARARVRARVRGRYRRAMPTTARPEASSARLPCRSPLGLGLGLRLV